MVIHIAGLGPGGATLLTRDVEDLLHSGMPVLLRTRRHPAVTEIAGSDAWEACDDIYASGGDFADVYPAIAARVLERAKAGDIVFAVPGHPLIAEEAAASVVALADASGIPVAIHTGLSFIDAAAAALRVNLAEVQVCDALALRVDCQRPALIAQVFDRDTAATLKVALLDLYPAEHPVALLKGLCTAAEQVSKVPLFELDHGPWGYLDSVYVPALAPEADVRRFDGLQAIVRRLHAPDGCPWDREQTHVSLRHYLLEETYEVLEAIDRGDAGQLTEELGDLLLQVLMHSSVGEREDTFSFADVSEQIARKLVRRHPHVFADAASGSAAEVHQRWDELKKAEKPRSSALEGVPASLPALAQSQSVQGRARRAGFDWPGTSQQLEKLAEEISEFAAAEGDPAEREAEFGDILFVAAGIGQRLGVDAEQALRGATARFRERFAIVESSAAGRGIDLHAADWETILALWSEAKTLLAAGRPEPPGGIP